MAWLMPDDPRKAGQKATVLTTSSASPMLQPRPARQDARKGPKTSSTQRPLTTPPRRDRGRPPRDRAPPRAGSRRDGGPAPRGAAESVRPEQRRIDDLRQSSPPGLPASRAPGSAVVPRTTPQPAGVHGVGAPRRHRGRAPSRRAGRRPDRRRAT